MAVNVTDISKLFGNVEPKKHKTEIIQRTKRY